MVVTDLADRKNCRNVAFKSCCHMAAVFGTSLWPNIIGEDLVEHSQVICSITSPTLCLGDNLLGYVQCSQCIDGLWLYSVALSVSNSPAPEMSTQWILVERVNASQLTPVGRSVKHPGVNVTSNAKIIDVNYKYVPIQAAQNALAVGPSSTRLTRHRANECGGPVHDDSDPTLSTGKSTSSLAKFAIQKAGHSVPKMLACRFSGTPVSFGKQSKINPASGLQDDSMPLSLNGLDKSPALASKEAEKPASFPGIRKRKKKQRVLICVHGKRQSVCVECKGGSICVHGKQRYWCKECGGKAWCSHGKQKSRCVDCGGSGICQHGKIRKRCELCVQTE
jgi:hypothetical protein